MSNFVIVDSDKLNAAMKASANAIRSKTGGTALIPWDENTGYSEAIDAMANNAPPEDLDAVLSEQEALITELSAILDQKAAGPDAPDPILQEKTVVPAEAAQEVTADEGFDALRKVTVESIPPQYVVPAGSVEITENGEYDVAGKETVVVAVSNKATLQDIEITENGTYSADEGFDGFGRVTVNVAESGGGNTLNEFLAGTLEEVDCDEVTTINQYFFYNNPGIKKVRLKNATTLENYNFRKCDNLVEIDLPEVTTIGTYFGYDCGKLETVIIPKVTTLGNYSFQSAPVIERLDLPAVESMGNYCLRYTTALTTLILRWSGGVVSRGSSVLSGSGIANKKGYIYVPATLIEDYKVASGWSTLASQFRALEDYTVDGTITGALDPAKIAA